MTEITAERITQQPLTLGKVTLRNRLASAPMERNYCDTEGNMTAQYMDYLLARADAGVALVTTEATYVRADGKGRTHQLGLHDDSCIAPLKDLATAIHERGAVIACELNHGGRTAQHKISGYKNVAPSPVPCEVAGGEMPRELTTAECYELAAEYGNAARRALQADIDVLNIHGGHGYLIHQFMSSISNHRDDEFAAPEKFLNEVIRAIRAVAPELALGLRISVLEGPADGISAQEQVEIIRKVETGRLDFLDLSAGSYEAGEWIVQSGEWKPGVLAEYAKAYRQFGLPLGMAGRLNSPEVIEQVLRDGTTDFVSLARALHADPDFARGCLEGTPYRPCIACNVCIDNLGQGQVTCSVNPQVGRGRIPVATPRVRPTAKVVVAGAGPAGLTAARELAVAGAHVTLVEESEAIGGEMAVAASMKSTPDFHRFLDWSAAENERLGIDVRLGAAVDNESLEQAHPDAVILAVGGRHPAATFAGADAENVVDIRRWLDENGTDAAVEAVTIWGADAVAMSVADTLASRDVSVLMVGQQSQIAPESGRRAKILAVPRLMANPLVQIFLESEITAYRDGQICMTNNKREQWLHAPGPLLISQGVAARTIHPDEGLESDTAVPTSIAAGAMLGMAGATISNAVKSGYDAAQEVAYRLQLDGHNADIEPVTSPAAVVYQSRGAVHD